MLEDSDEEGSEVSLGGCIRTSGSGWNMGWFCLEIDLCMDLNFVLLGFCFDWWAFPWVFVC